MPLKNVTDQCFSLLFALAAAILLYGAAPLSAQVKGNNGVVLQSSNLPIVIIDTHGQPIVNEPKITADMGIIYNGAGVRNNVTDPQNNYKGKIGIEIRGSSSQWFPKKQYGVETRDSLGANLDVSLLGMPAENDWILFGPYNDKTLMRDAMIYKISNMIGMYATRSMYCEVVLNNQYIGVYVLFEKIKRDKNRVAITKLEPKDTTGDALTGGYIVKVDKTDGNVSGGWYSSFPCFPNSTKMVYYQYHDPSGDELAPVQRSYIMGKVYAFEYLMNSAVFADSVNGYPKFIDVPSFVNFAIVNEFAKNVDGYRLSSFMYKDRDSKGGKFKMGPVWDFNLGCGNADYYNGWLTTGWQVDFLSSLSNYSADEAFFIPFWWKKLFDEPKFQLALKTQWTTLRKTTLSNQSIFGKLDSLSQLLAESRSRNFVQWPVLGQYIWPNYYVGATYNDEYNYLKNWITARLSWMDSKLLLPNSIEKENTSEKMDFTLKQNYPNPFNPVTVINYSIAANTCLSSAGNKTQVKLTVYDLLGREIETLVNTQQAVGSYSVQFDGSKLNSGMYIYQLTAGGNSIAGKMQLLK